MYKIKKGCTPAGRLQTRTWARGIVTTYSYDANTGELLNVDYSDTTPDITFTYDRLGRKATINDAAGTRTLNYDPQTLRLIAEDRDGVLDKTLSRSYDALGRPNGLSVGSDYGVSFGYTSTGRMQQIVDGSDTFTYSYVNDSDLLQSVTGPVMNTTYSYEPNRGVKTVVDNTVSGSTVSKYSYDYDELGRRQNRVQEGTAFSQDSFDDFEYNPRSEVTGSERFAGTNPTDTSNPLTGLDFAYEFDNIGNRISFTENSDLTEYTSNALNQYSSVSSAQSADNYSYDADGNLTFDGQFNYSWNGENRLVQVTSAVVTEGAKRLTFWYDHQGRRFQKRVEEYQSGAWNEIELTRFLYDSWNLIAEYDVTSGTNYLDKTYVWGLDLSLSPQGAGGVGGLLSMTEESSSDTYYYAFDANGNVTQLIDESGSLAAHYEYSPFGKLTTSSGPMADANPFRFSSKYQDQATGLLYYGFRYMDTSTGRWLSRDPLSFMALFEANYNSVQIDQDPNDSYHFIINDPISKIDLLGLRVVLPGDPPSADCKPGDTAEEPSDVFECCLTCDKCEGDIIPCLDDCKDMKGRQPLICETSFFGFSTRWVDNGDPYPVGSCTKSGLSCGDNCNEGDLYISQDV